MKNEKLLVSAVATFALASAFNVAAAHRRPNIIYIMADDHASQAISAYGGILAGVLPTPNIDRIGREGVKLNNCFATNSISTPSRAAILTGEYSQKNGVYTLQDKLDIEHPTVAKELQKAGYRTGMLGKWHLKTEPQGFDYYNVLPDQGRYHNPILIKKGEWGDPNHDMRNGKLYEGHSTDVITDEALSYLSSCKKDEPFFLMCHYKAPHRSWNPAERFQNLLKDVTIPEPENLYDDYDGKGQYAEILRMSMEHLTKTDLKTDIPSGMSRDEQRKWAYQLYIKDYLRCIAGIDENVGRILKYLDDNNLTENTIIIYTSDQGFFLGEHGWFDKRLMYEECIRMPFLMRYPKEIKAGTVNNDIILNIDFAPLFLDYAAAEKPSNMQGESFRANVAGKTAKDWRKSMYYRYWMHRDINHFVAANYGIRTDRYKLIFYYGQPLGMSGAGKEAIVPAEWELYDLKNDPKEMKNIYGDPKNAKLIKELKSELLKLKTKYGDEDSQYPEMKSVVENYYW
ncbi:MAG: sulfatase [Rikenellaceae bacterium]